MGEKVLKLVAMLVFMSFIFAFAAPVLAQDEGEGEPPDDGGPPDVTTPPAYNPADAPENNANGDNQSSPGALPVSTLGIAAIVGIVAISLIVVGVRKHLSGKPKGYQPELEGAEPPTFSSRL